MELTRIRQFGMDNPRYQEGGYLVWKAVGMHLTQKM